MQLPPISGDVTELTIEASHESYDPLDEILALFRANTFFRNFEIKGPADRVLIYGILYVSEVLSKIKQNMGKRDAEKVRVCLLACVGIEGRGYKRRAGKRGSKEVRETGQDTDIMSSLRPS